MKALGPSTGFRAAVWALHACGKVSVYGYGSQPGVPHTAYYSNRTDEHNYADGQSSHHNFTAEYLELEFMDALGQLELNV